MVREIRKARSCYDPQRTHLRAVDTGGKMLYMLDDRVAVIPVEEPDMIGSLWIPDQAKRRSDQGIIKYRGDNVKELRVGDHVLFSQYTGTRITYQDEGHLIIMRDSDVLALIGEPGEILFARAQVVKMFGSAVDHVLNQSSKEQTIERLAEAFEAELDSFDASLVEF